MGKIKKCGICGDDIENTNYKYCSTKCVNKSQALRMQRWRIDNPERVKKMSKRRYYENPIRAKRFHDNWILNNKEKYSKTNAEYYRKNRETILVRARDRKIVVKIKCEICGIREKLEIHHFWYKPSICIVVCHECHLKLHGQTCRKS